MNPQELACKAIERLVDYDDLFAREVNKGLAARTERAATDHPRAAGPRGDMVGVRQFTSQVVCVQWPQGQGFRGR